MFWIYDIPSWALGFVIVGSLLLCSCIGLIISRDWIYRYFKITHDTLDSINGFFSAMGMLYGLLMGLVAVSAWENYQNVGSIVDIEATVIAQLYCDVSTLQEPSKTRLQNDLQDYLHYIIDVNWPAHRKGIIKRGGQLILTRFIKTATTYQPANAQQQIISAEVFTAYNSLIDARRARLQAIDTGLPAQLWVVIIIGGGIMVLMSYFIYMPSLRTHVLMTAVFSTLLGLMIFLIASLDHPFRGEVSVSSDAYKAVLDNVKDFDPGYVTTIVSNSPAK
ncbi:MAG: hypothetical protein WCS87_08215 [Methylococcaceae bacterium]